MTNNNKTKKTHTKAQKTKPYCKWKDGSPKWIYMESCEWPEFLSPCWVRIRSKWTGWQYAAVSERNCSHKRGTLWERKIRLTQTRSYLRNCGRSESSSHLGDGASDWEWSLCTTFLQSEDQQKAQQRSSYCLETVPYNSNSKFLLLSFHSSCFQLMVFLSAK